MLRYKPLDDCPKILHNHLTGFRETREAKTKEINVSCSSLQRVVDKQEG